METVMITTVRGKYLNQRIELDTPLQIKEGEEVEVQVLSISTAKEEAEAFTFLGMERLEEVWDNPEDAIYDDWKKHANRLP
jgi:hypothetical protein